MLLPGAKPNYATHKRAAVTIRIAYAGFVFAAFQLPATDNQNKTATAEAVGQPLGVVASRTGEFYASFMLTRIEISGFKTFDDFSLDLQPLTAIVGPNATGKSNLFDAIRFISLLAQNDIRTAMLDLRGQPEELFRQAQGGQSDTMTFAVEVLLDRTGLDDFNTPYEIFAQRLRYEVTLAMAKSRDGTTRGVYVTHEHCRPLAKAEDRSRIARGRKLSYNSRVNPFIRVNETGDAILVRQDGRQKHGRPVQFALKEASRTALSTVQTAEFPHLYALREILTRLRFLEINPRAARNANDLFEERELRSDASNLSAVLARLKEESATDTRPQGVLADIVADLASLIPSVSALNVESNQALRQYSFDLGFVHDQRFSSRVISDGTIRLLALLTVLNDPNRRGTLCFEEPENGVHEGRIPSLIKLLRASTSSEYDPLFQILLNTHSPKVMEALHDDEIVAADTVTMVDPHTGFQATKTRMRAGMSSVADMFDPQKHLSRVEIERLLQHSIAAA